MNQKPNSLSKRNKMRKSKSTSERMTYSINGDKENRDMLDDVICLFKSNEKYTSEEKRNNVYFCS